MGSAAAEPEEAENTQYGRRVLVADTFDARKFQERILAEVDRLFGGDGAVADPRLVLGRALDSLSALRKSTLQARLFRSLRKVTNLPRRPLAASV